MSVLHLRPQTQLAPDVLLTGDPDRVHLLARSLHSVEPFNDVRGLAGVTGVTQTGGYVTVQSTGMGGPSAVIVLSELVELGARRLIRLGSCGGLATSSPRSRAVIASSAIGFDGTSRALGNAEPLLPDRGLTERLISATGPFGASVSVGAVASTDLLYSPKHRLDTSVALAAVDMETAPLFAFAATHGVRAASMLAVSATYPGGQRRGVPSDDVADTSLRLFDIAVTALAA